MVVVYRDRSLPAPPATWQVVPENDLRLDLPGPAAVYVRSSNGYRIDGGGSSDAGEVGARNE